MAGGASASHHDRRAGSARDLPRLWVRGVRASRDLWDTLYVSEAGADSPRPATDGTILRTHTSPVQIRAMRALTPPIRVIMPGRCFRYEAVDASHNFEF